MASAIETSFLFILEEKISNTRKLRKDSELQVRIELTSFRVLVRMLFPEPKKHAAGPKTAENLDILPSDCLKFKGHRKATII